MQFAEPLVYAVEHDQRFVFGIGHAWKAFHAVPSAGATGGRSLSAFRRLRPRLRRGAPELAPEGPMEAGDIAEAGVRRDVDDRR